MKDKNTLEGITLTRRDFEILWSPNTKFEFIEDIGKQRKVWELKN